MAKLQGTSIPLSVGRRLVCELLHHAKQVPSLPLARDCDLSPLAVARKTAPASPSWMALLMKAYALAAREIPELRRAYLPYPRPRLYEHPRSECAVLVERDWQGEATVLAAKVHGPEEATVALLDEHLRRFRDDEVQAVSPFRQLLRVGALPAPLRRFVFWSTLYLSGATRAKRFGTFMMSSLGNLGAEQIHPITPLTTYFTFGPIRDGRATLKIVYDHRVMDGRTVARALQTVERLANTVVANELTTQTARAA